MRVCVCMFVCMHMYLLVLCLSMFAYNTSPIYCATSLTLRLQQTFKSTNETIINNNNNYTILDNNNNANTNHKEYMSKTSKHYTTHHDGKVPTNTVLDINYADENKRTPLILASMCSRSSTSTKIFNALLKCGADVLRTDKYGYNCLHMACEYNQLDIVDMLIASAHMNLENEDHAMRTGLWSFFQIFIH